MIAVGPEQDGLERDRSGQQRRPRPDLVAPAAAVTAWVGVGANLGDAAEAVRAACLALGQQHGVRLVAVSRRFRNPPLGPAQPDYVNAVARIETRLSPRELLETLWSLEQAAGRDTRGPRWGARTLDLDLLLFGDEAFSVPGLTVPHAGLRDRVFVLVPMADLVVDWPLPRPPNTADGVSHGARDARGPGAGLSTGASVGNSASGDGAQAMASMSATLRDALRDLPKSARAAMRPLDVEPLFVSQPGSDAVGERRCGGAAKGVTARPRTVGVRDDSDRDAQGRGIDPWISPAA